MRGNALLTTALLAAVGQCQDTYSGSLSGRAGTKTRGSKATKVEPCAEVASSWAAQKDTNPRPTVAASLAYACQQSVPLGKAEAINFVDSIKPYLEWQSDAAYKADPPADYGYPGYDMFKTLDNIKAKLQNDQFDNEYDFQAELYSKVFGPGHDGHFILYPDALAKAFRYGRKRSLVSISKDDEALPQIKIYEDVIANPDTASAVTKINGVAAAKFVEDSARIAAWNQDVDSAYNGQFHQASLKPFGNAHGFFSASGRGALLYQGNSTTFEFANGTSVTFPNIATVNGDMTNIKDGASYYKKFCYVAPGATVPNSNSGASKVSDDHTVPGYPKPIMATTDGIVSGYYLEGEGVENVAVIVLLAFENPNPSEFQATIRDFFNTAVADGKTKLVIDFQGNGGGYILLGYDFFRQLFPNIQEDGYSRWKGNAAYIDIAHIVSDELEDFDPATSNNRGLIADSTTTFNYRHDLNRNLENFESFDDKFAPYRYKNTDYTNLMRWNLSDPLTTTNTTFGMGMEISGYGKLKNLAQPFEAHNIVMLYDGVCASTCTLASEMLRIQGGVKSIAMGGRPKAGAIQGVGGVKGSQVYSWKSVWKYASGAARLSNDKAVKKELGRYTSLPLLRSTAAALNVRDQILRDNLEDGTPAQFIKEDADCRLYWTAPMLEDVTEVWKAAANSAFNGAKCAAGGIQQPEKRSGGEALASQPDHVKRAMKFKLTVPDAIKKAIPPLQDEKWQEIYQQKAI